MAKPPIFVVLARGSVVELLSAVAKPLPIEVLGEPWGEPELAGLGRADPLLARRARVRAASVRFAPC